MQIPFALHSRRIHNSALKDVGQGRAEYRFPMERGWGEGKETTAPLNANSFSWQLKDA